MEELGKDCLGWTAAAMKVCSIRAGVLWRVYMCVLQYVLQWSVQSTAAVGVGGWPRLQPGCARRHSAEGGAVTAEPASCLRRWLLAYGAVGSFQVALYSRPRAFGVTRGQMPLCFADP